MKPYVIVVYLDQNIIKVFLGDIGTVDNVRMIEQDGEVYLNMKDLSKMLCLEEEADETLQIYTYRSL